MAVFSTLLRSSAQNLKNSSLLLPGLNLKNAAVYQIQCRNMSGHFNIEPSRWQWHKTKDYFHFYFMVAAIPLSIITFCANVFIGPATLTPIPEGYEPEHYEYHKSPITRFLARYGFGTPQKNYEKTVFVIWEQDQLRKIRALEDRVYAIMNKRQDYRYGYFTPIENITLRDQREVVKYFNDGIIDS